MRALLAVHCLPAEAVHAAVKAGQEQELKEVWRVAFLTAKFKFVVVDKEEDKMYMSIKLRNRIVHNADVAGRTMLQRLLEFVEVVARTDGGLSKSPTAMAHLWNTNIGGSSGPSGEPITETYVTNAMNVYKDMLTDDGVRRALLESEEQFNRKSPFDSITKLEAIMSKCKKNPHSMQFVIRHITDTIVNGLSTAGEYALRTMTGKGQNNKGTLDIFLLKRSLLLHLAVAYAGEHEMLKDQFTAGIFAQLQTHAGYRALSGFAHSKKAMPWWPQMKQSARTLFEVIEDLVYKPTWDHIIRNVLRHQSAEAGTMLQEILDTTPVSDAMAQITAFLAEECPTPTPPPDGACAGTPGVGGEVKISGEVTLEHVAGPDLGADIEDRLRPWLEYADKTVSQWVTLGVEPDTGSQLGDWLKLTALPNITGTPKADHVLAYYDCKQAGTSDTAPHIRHPNFRAGHLRKCIVGFQEARGSSDDIKDGDLFMILDAFAHGNHDKIAASFNKLSEPKPMNKHKTTYFVAYEQGSLRARKQTKRAAMVDQVEQMVVFSGDVARTPPCRGRKPVPSPACSQCTCACTRPVAHSHEHITLALINRSHDSGTSLHTFMQV